MKLTNASSPHVRGRFKTSWLMLDVVIGLLPALVVGVWKFGPRALLVVALSIACAVGTEWLYSRITRGRNTVVDCSALVTGLLLAMTLPVSVPFWLVAVGSVFAVLVVKLLCGGLGQNIFNPALTARALMLLVYPMGMTVYHAADAASSATPLHTMVKPALPEQSLFDMFMGNCPGSIGEISSLALLAGGVWMVCRKVITPRIPLAYLGAVGLLTLVFSRAGDPVIWMLYSLCSGGVMLGAIFMATDYATSPVTAWGQLVYGVGCGVLTVLLRYNGLYPEGVTYAILIMNGLVWVLDRYAPARRFGTGRAGGAK